MAKLAFCVADDARGSPSEPHLGNNDSLKGLGRGLTYFNL